MEIAVGRSDSAIYSLSEWSRPDSGVSFGARGEDRHGKDRWSYAPLDRRANGPRPRGKKTSQGWSQGRRYQTRKSW